MRSFFTRGWAAIKSRKRAASLGIALKLIRPLSIIFDSALPKRKLNVNEAKAFPPLFFIVSPPRSGSTVIYQVLVRCIECIFFSNWHFLFPKSASKLFSNQLNRSLPFVFRNYYGYTPHMNDVNEGNEVFDKLFSGDDASEIRSRFKKFLSSFAIEAETPVIFKNVRNYENIALIAKAIPEMNFLCIKRDLNQNIQSELKGYRELGNFHPIPKHLAEINYNLAPVQFATKQIFSISKEIDLQLLEVAPERKFIIQYETFCKDPQSVLSKLAGQFNITNKMKQDRIEKLKLRASFSRKVSNREELEIKTELEKLSNERD